MASMEAAAFSRPDLQDNPLLNIYISHLDGWESAKPVSFVRYEEMDKSDSKGFFKLKKEAKPLRAGEVEYEYAFPTVDKKPFKERASLYIAFTPQSISKSMTPEYNVSTEYLRQRAKSETPRMAYTLTANLHYELKNHKFIETGINYTQIYEEMHFEGDNLLGTVEILTTPSGNILRELFKSGIRLGISSRGMGSVEPMKEDKDAQEVQNDFELIAFDFVSNPSTHGAFMNPVNESVNRDEQIRSGKWYAVDNTIGKILRGE